MIITRKWLNKYILNFDNISDNEIIIALNNLGLEVNKIINFNNNFYICQIINIKKEYNKIEKKYFNIYDIDVFITDTINNKIFIKEIIKYNSIIMNLENNIEKNIFFFVKNKNKKNIDNLKNYNFFDNFIFCNLKDFNIEECYLTDNEKKDFLFIKFEKKIIINNKNINFIFNFLNDTIFEIDLTLNKNYCLSFYEIAKELSVVFKRKIKPLLLNFNNKKILNYNNNFIIKNFSKDINIIHSLSIELIDKFNNNHLSLSKRIWLKFNKYKSDINNPLLDLAMETAIMTGQPLLIYDKNKFVNNFLVITDDYENKEFNISKGDLVIIDGNNFVELIGIKKNNNYNISNNTKEILVICLNIDNYKMRKQQKKHNLTIFNINLQRYIKKLSFSIIDNGIKYYLNLLNENNYIKNISKINKIKNFITPSRFIKIDLNYINKIIGYNFDYIKIKKILEPLSFKIKIHNNNNKKLIINPPLIREDLITKEDIISEIIKIFGYNKIVPKPPKMKNIFKFNNLNLYINNEKEILFKNIKNYLVNKGFYEVKTYSLVNYNEIKKFNFFNYQNPNILLSPISKEHKIMKLSLLNSLLNISIYNNVREINNINLFSIEKIYFNNLDFNYHLCFTIQNNFYENIYLKNQDNNLFYYIKGLFEEIILKAGIDINSLDYKLLNIEKLNNYYDIFHPYQTILIYFNKKIISIIGLINQKYSNDNNLKKTFFCEINLSIIINYLFNNKNNNKNNFINNNLYKFNSFARDISILVKKDFFYKDIILKIIKDVNFLVDINLLDLYYGKQIPDDSKSITISFIFNDNNKKLNSLDIDKEFEKIILNCKKNKFIIR